MDVLFVCKRIYLDGEFVNGGIVSSAEDGTIIDILRGQEQLNTFMYANESAEVSIVNCVVMFQMHLFLCSK